MSVKYQQWFPPFILQYSSRKLQCSLLLKNLYVDIFTLFFFTGEGSVDAGELDFFLRGNTSLAKAQTEKSLNWISEKGWKDLLLLTGRFDGF
jgi:hypothetical protein